MRKRTLLLYQAGLRVRKIFKQIPDRGTGVDYELAKEKLKAHFDLQKNKRYEVYPFQQVMQFHTRLQTMAERCKFIIEFEIEEQIIIRSSSTKVCKLALRDPTFDLKAMLIEGHRDKQTHRRMSSARKNVQQLQKI